MSVRALNTDEPRVLQHAQMPVLDIGHSLGRLYSLGQQDGGIGISTSALGLSDARGIDDIGWEHRLFIAFHIQTSAIGSLKHLNQVAPAAIEIDALSIHPLGQLADE